MVQLFVKIVQVSNRGGGHIFASVHHHDERHVILITRLASQSQFLNRDLGSV
jgi:hypothetical protein